MATPIIIKLDVKKLIKDWFFAGAKGTYVDLILYENDRESPYGDSHTLKQSPSKDARAKGEKAIICGNGKWMPQKGGQQQRSQATPAKQNTSAQDNMESDEPPF